MAERPPNHYLVYSLGAAPASAASAAYERLQHECLRAPDAVKLLDELRALTESRQEELAQSVSNYSQQTLTSAVRVSARQCPRLQATLERAQQKISRVFGERAAGAAQARLFTRLDAGANASSLALPSGRPVVLVTDALVRLLAPAELELVLLHELAHIVYTDSRAAVGMKMKLALLGDGTLAGTRRAQGLLGACNVLQAGFELTADRAMLQCAGAEQWPAVLSMFAKLAGGAVGEPLDGAAFLEQAADMEGAMERTIVEAAIAANPHPPLLYRVQELQRFMQSPAFVGVEK
jgi:Zn-dependent protease with chaperone function